MIGGTVLETIEVGDRIWINCKDKHSTSECAIYVKKTHKSKSVSEGDTVWWQGSRAFWTPSFYRQGSGKSHKDFDIVLERIGFSGVNKPEPLQT